MKEYIIIFIYITTIYRIFIINIFVTKTKFVEKIVVHNNKLKTEMKQFKINKSITPRSEESLDKYLTEISRVPMISTEEEIALAQAIHAGGKKGKIAKDKLVTANLRFVVSVAKQYQNQGVALTDLISEGNIGLITAADKFDETRGFKFISYAIWWIRQSILQAIAEYSNVVRRPLNQIAISNKIKKATNAFIQKYQRYPSAEELSEIISLEIDKIEKAIQAEAHVASLDAPIIEDEGSTGLSRSEVVFGQVC